VVALALVILGVCGAGPIVRAVLSGPRGVVMFKQVRSWGAGVAAGMGGLVGAAHAEVPTAVTTALTNLQADALTVAGTVLAAIVAIYAFKFIRKGL